jgi:uncharacterized protein (UPF0335 family)
MAKTREDRIESVQEQIRQLENQKKRLMQEQKEQGRKARTKRLIERGAILESLIPEADTFTNEQIRAFLEKTIRTESARKAWVNLNTAQAEPAAAKAAGAARGSSGDASQTTDIATGRAD